MVKKIIVLLLMMCSSYVYAQDARQIARDNSTLKNTEIKFIHLDLLSQSNQHYQFPFSGILFRDVRFDTSSIGVTNRLALLGDKNKFRYVQLQSGLAGFLDNYFNSLPQQKIGAATDELVCYIKKFRIVEKDSTYETSVKKARELQIKAVVEAYDLHNSRLYPAIRIDTTFSERLLDNVAEYYIIDSFLYAFAQKLSKIDTGKVLRRNAYTEAEVAAKYNQRFALPILSATSFKKGVYASKEEFFKNAPSMTEYEWKPDAKVNLLYTKDGNSQWNITRKNIFGFCDGENIWLVAENSFYPAFRRENTFEMIAPLLLKRVVNNKPTTYSVPVGPYSYFISIPSKYNSIYYDDKSIYQMDMETGEFY